MFRIGERKKQMSIIFTEEKIYIKRNLEQFC